jgi:hypothetical protein
MIRIASVLVISALAAVGCANRTTTADKTVIAPKEAKVAQARGEHIVTRIAFTPGQTELSGEARAELDRALAEAQRVGKIDDVTVAVWADSEYPAGRERKLPSRQVNLASERGENIEEYIASHEDVTGWDVAVHNMGKKPNYLSEWLRTADAKLKHQLVERGVAKSADEPEITDRASSALVFIKVK